MIQQPKTPPERKEYDSPLKRDMKNLNPCYLTPLDIKALNYQIELDKIAEAKKLANHPSGQFR